MFMETGGEQLMTYAIFARAIYEKHAPQIFVCGAADTSLVKPAVMIQGDNNGDLLTNQGSSRIRVRSLKEGGPFSTAAIAYKKVDRSYVFCSSCSFCVYRRGRGHYDEILKQKLFAHDLDIRLAQPG